MSILQAGSKAEVLMAKVMDIWRSQSFGHARLSTQRSLSCSAACPNDPLAMAR